VLGSAPPLEDCFHPERVPDDATLAREHGEHARHLVEAGADAVLVETMNTIREAVAAVRAARECGAPVFASFVSRGRARLLSGEPLDEAVDAVARLGPLAVGVNCLPPGAVPPCLAVLQRAQLPFFVYANLIGPGEERSPEEYARCAAGWIEAGARIVGGCCGKIVSPPPDPLRANCRNPKRRGAVAPPNRAVSEDPRGRPAWHGPCSIRGCRRIQLSAPGLATPPLARLREESARALHLFGEIGKRKPLARIHETLCRERRGIMNDPG
jgi:hypothetical protein